MKITFEDYMRNPLGKPNPLYNVAVKEAIRTDYSKRFDMILVRENGKVDYTWYYDKKHNVYYCHIKIPSEAVDRFYYDVVIRFFADEGTTGGGQNLENYYVQFYSNDPAFVYTYANTFITNDLFIKDLLPKMGRKAIKQPAKEKNPQGFAGYVKTIYFAYLFLRMKGMLNTTVIDGYLRPYSKNDLLKAVRYSDDVIEKRQEEGEKHSKKKVKENRANNRNVTSDQLNIGRVQSVGKVKNVSSIGRVGSVKSVKKR